MITGIWSGHTPLLGAMGGYYTPAVQAVSRTLLHNGTDLYPHLVRLEHNGSANDRIVASVISCSGNNGVGMIYERTNGGDTFTQVGTIADPKAANGKGLCCGTLYELPQPISNMPAGILGTGDWGARVFGGV